MATCKNQEIHLNDIGTAFEITLNDCTGVVDLSTATVKQFIFTPPSGSANKKIVDAVFKVDGTDGVLVYNTVAGDLDEVGTWSLQAKVTMPTGSWSSSITKFKVYDNL